MPTLRAGVVMRQRTFRETTAIAPRSWSDHSRLESMRRVQPFDAEVLITRPSFIPGGAARLFVLRRRVTDRPEWRVRYDPLARLIKGIGESRV